MPNYETPYGHCRLLLFRGSREDALQSLPCLCPGEQLEVGSDRISLVTEQQRVDLYIRAELPVDAADTSSMMLVEICFSDIENEHADSFVQCFQRGQAVLH